MQWKRTLSMVGIAVVCSVALWAMMGSGSESTAESGAMKLICQSPNCRHEFRMSPAEAKQFLAEHPGQSLSCPKCGGIDLLQEGAVARDRTPARRR